MSTTTTIEWTDTTWNPTTGCDRISPGCDNCYALTMAKRLKAMGQAKYQTDGDPRTSGPGFGLAGHPDVLEEPMYWRKPRRVFVNSMSDLFHARVTTELVTRVWEVMQATPQHTYQILTKRPQRLARVLEQVHQSLGITEPLPNVWLGASVENQKYADLRVPALLKAPAAIRFLSCEPLLGPVDLAEWVQPISPMDPAAAPTTWAEWTWPDWVPVEVRKQVEDFWGVDQGRTPRDWIRDMHQQGAPAFGSVVRLRDGFGPDALWVTGRFVHAWNNIGRLVRDDGTFGYTSFHHGLERRRQQPIGWVITGGESGPGARPAHPDWFRSLRDQCAAAEVSYLHKQNGEWAERSTVPSEDWVSAWDEKRVTYVHPEDGRRQSHGEWGMSDHLEGWACVQRVGKKAAGRELDGRTWDQFPKAVA